MPPRGKSLPLSVKLKLLDDLESGCRPKALMKKYKIKKSIYYRILGEKKQLMNLDIKSEPKFEIESGDYDDDDYQEVDSTENGDKMHDGNEDEHSTASDTAQSLDGVNQAVMQWYTKQEAEGVPVNNVDIDEAAERLAQELGFTDFKLNSTGWPLRFRKPQDVGKTTENDDDDDDDDDDDPGLRVKKVLRIQDQITAFQRLQAGESAEQIAGDLGVSKATILSVKKKLKDTLFTPSLDQNYKIKVENQTKNESENPYDETEDGTMATITPKCESTKETVWALIERRKRLKFSKNGIPRKDRSLTYDEKVLAIEQFKSGTTLRQIARNFSVSNSTIHRVKKEFSKSHQLAYKNYMKLEEKVNVLERLDEGDTIAEIAENIKVNESTVRSIKKNRIKIMNVFKASIRSISIAPATTPILSTKEKIEQKLLVWINDLKRRKMPIHSAMILKKALMIQMSISQEKGSSSSHTFTPSKDWLNSFKKRHNIQKLLHEESESASESDGQWYWKAGPGPKSKKKYMAAPRSVSHHTYQPRKEGMTLSKFAEGLREMYLNRDLPENPNRCNSFTPRIILVRQEQDPVVKYTMLDAVKNEPVSDEETWLTGHTNAGSDSDWGEENDITHSHTEIYKSKDNHWKKRKKTSSEYSRKRRRLSDGDDSDRSVVDYNKSSYLNVPIKQEPQDTLPSNVPMAVLPAGSTYVPPLPMFQMQQGGLTVMPGLAYMPESQQMMMQHSINYPHNNSSDLFMNQQQLRGRTIGNSHSGQFNDIPDEASVEPNIRQDNENMIVMPFGGDLCEQEKSKQLPFSNPNSVVCDSLEEKARKERAAAIAESIGISLEGSSNKKLRDLTFRLLELNNKNLICDERIDNAREEYEKTVTHNQTEKKLNDKEIDKVLAAIQEWKEAKTQAGT